MRSFICPHSSTWEHINTRKLYFVLESCWCSMFAVLREYFFFTFACLAPIWMYGFVENWKLNLLEKSTVRKNENWRKYWQNTETAIYSAAPLTRCFVMKLFTRWIVIPAREKKLIVIKAIIGNQKFSFFPLVFHTN
jgi:hypothetical protein